ncbi:MAG: hypothetical protein WBP81_06730 [Solirubrobacteraceae bacterium]
MPLTDGTDDLRVLIADERKDRLALVAAIVVALGHEVIAREIDVEDVGAVTAALSSRRVRRARRLVAPGPARRRQTARRCRDVRHVGDVGAKYRHALVRDLLGPRGRRCTDGHNRSP